MLLQSEMKDRWHELITESFLDAFPSEVLQSPDEFVVLLNQLITCLYGYMNKKKTDIVT